MPGPDTIPSLSGMCRHIPVADHSLLVMSGGSAIATAPSLNSAVTNSRSPRRRRSDIETYTVQDGDTISTIASSFGVSSSTILWANDLGARDFIRAGQELSVLPVDGVQHTVSRGDTLSKIARRYDVDEDEILEFNQLEDAGKLAVAATLIIPNGVPPRRIATRSINRAPSISDIRNVLKPPSSNQSGNLIWPTSGHYITQYWGWRHTGVDIDGHYDSPLYASASGAVEIAGWGRGYGIQALINHQNGFKTRYAHMSKIFVVPGQRVTQGEVIGMVGTTGYSSGTHLHYEVYVNGVRRNPLLYIR